MTSTDVFIPSNGELLIRDNLANGLATSDMFYRKSRDGRRPETMGGYRFGQLSHSSFFTRHNPHPRRVSHMKGLLDVPICSVNDRGFFANAKYSLQFPPNSYNNNLLTQRLPVNAINVNSQLYPINTITGLQNFTGLQSGPFREKAVGQAGSVSLPEAWRDELKALTRAAGLEVYTPPAEKLPEITRTPKKTMYSATTGRLIPPPSRMATGRLGTKGRRTGAASAAAGFDMDDPDQETKILQMLCQILQTEDISAVQTWLVNAGMKEKNVVLDMIKMALDAKEDYYQQYPPPGAEEYLTEMEKGGGDVTIGGDTVQNRLTTGEREGQGQMALVPDFPEVVIEEEPSELHKLNRDDVEKMLMPRRVSRDVSKWATQPNLETNGDAAGPLAAKPPVTKLRRTRSVRKEAKALSKSATKDSQLVPLPATPRPAYMDENEAH